jgi:hypothetical protein
MVTNSNDAGTGSLRAEIALATANGAANSIEFSPSLAGATIGLKTVGNSSFGPSALGISTAITIVGSGQTITLASSAAAMRIFEVGTSGKLTVEDLTISGGVAKGVLNSGNAGIGGAIYNEGTLTLIGVTLKGNEAIGAAYKAAGGSGATGGGGSIGGGVSIGGGGTTGGGTTGGGTTGGGTTRNDRWRNNRRRLHGRKRRFHGRRRFNGRSLHRRERRFHGWRRFHGRCLHRRKRRLNRRWRFNGRSLHRR